MRIGSLKKRARVARVLKDSGPGCSREDIVANVPVWTASIRRAVGGVKPLRKFQSQNRTDHFYARRVVNSKYRDDSRHRRFTVAISPNWSLMQPRTLTRDISTWPWPSVVRANEGTTVVLIPGTFDNFTWNPRRSIASGRDTSTSVGSKTRKKNIK